MEEFPDNISDADIISDEERGIFEEFFAIVKPNTDPKINTPLLREELTQLIDETVVNEKDREVIKMYFFDGLNSAEIAERFSVSRSVICQRIKRGLRVLRRRSEYSPYLKDLNLQDRGPDSYSDRIHSLFNKYEVFWTKFPYQDDSRAPIRRVLLQIFDYDFRTTESNVFNLFFERLERFFQKSSYTEADLSEIRDIFQELNR